MFECVRTGYQLPTLTAPAFAAIPAAFHISPFAFFTRSRHLSIQGCSSLSSRASPLSHCCWSANTGRHRRRGTSGSSRTVGRVILLLGVEGALPACEREERTERFECAEEGSDGMVRGRRGVEGPAAPKGEDSSSATRAASTAAIREDERGVAVRGLMGEENFCRLEGVASASNSSSSSSMGPSNATLRLWLGVFVGERSALGARRDDLDGERKREREGVGAGGGSGGGIVASLVVRGFAGETVGALEGLPPALSEAMSSLIDFSTPLHTSCSASVISSN